MGMRRGDGYLGIDWMGEVLRDGERIGRLEVGDFGARSITCGEIGMKLESAC